MANYKIEDVIKKLELSVLLIIAKQKVIERTQTYHALASWIGRFSFG
jgi:hypothetical protein